MTGVLPNDIRRCAHRKTNGVPCGSPALKDKPYCYFHDRWREQHIDVADGTPYYQNVSADLPILEDANSIQMALTKVFHMLLAGLLDPRFAKSLIYCLSIAAQNLRNCNLTPKAEELGNNAPARADQSIGQNTNSDPERPEDSDWYMQERDREDAEILARQIAEIESNRQETVDIKAVAEEELQRPGLSRAAKPAFDLRASAGRPRVSRVSKLGKDSGKEGIVDLMAMDYRKPKLQFSSKFRRWDRPGNKKEEPKKKSKPAINLFDRLAQRRDECKKREGIM